MEQFSLDKYLENPTRKVCTRRGNPVRIICTDRKHGEDELPIVFLEECLNGEFLLSCRKDGRSDNYDTQYDLFFADEEEELTEFEKALLAAFNYVAGKAVTTIGFQEDVDEWSKPLLDLARKDLQPIFDKELDKAYEETDKIVFRNGYDKGKEETLKNFPKWKQMPSGISGDGGKTLYLIHKQDENFYYISPYIGGGRENEFYIELTELEKLPKEE